jgi:protoheme IX farnesyltransferase
MSKKLKLYATFSKLRLSFLVVVSALSGYLFNGGSDGVEIFLLMLGGMLLTAASNGSNQIWERDIDKLMKRTAQRPLPLNEMSLKEAYGVVVFCLVSGLVLLASINWSCFFLGVFAYVSYVFIYTPMKRKTPWAVFVGAFPGAIPPMLGAIAVAGEFGFVPGVLFFVQFCWQFPHFWAIAWVVDEDYRAGGFSLLPSKHGKGKNSAFQIVAYSLALIPFSLLPWWFEWTTDITMYIVLLMGGWFFYLAYRLFLTCEDKDAKKLMFASFIYLPIIQFAYVFDKVESNIPY